MLIAFGSSRVVMLCDSLMRREASSGSDVPCVRKWYGKICELGVQREQVSLGPQMMMGRGGGAPIRRRDGLLLSPARCAARRGGSLCEQSRTEAPRSHCVPAGALDDGWWALSMGAFFFFFLLLPACFNSVWLQVPNIAPASTSLFQKMQEMRGSTVSPRTAMKSAAAEWRDFW